MMNLNELKKEIIGKHLEYCTFNPITGKTEVLCKTGTIEDIEQNEWGYYIFGEGKRRIKAIVSENMIDLCLFKYSISMKMEDIYFYRLAKPNIAKKEGRKS
ncbi:MAG: hypothetical protein LUC18_02140 [Porphyromonadaceae bacterium]|nr:hypothetical protein [Porphyromonadaceae bacterium]